MPRRTARRRTGAAQGRRPYTIRGGPYGREHGRWPGGRAPARPGVVSRPDAASRRRCARPGVVRALRRGARGPAWCRGPAWSRGPIAMPVSHTRHPHDTRAAQGRRPYTIRGGPAQGRDRIHRSCVGAAPPRGPAWCRAARRGVARPGVVPRYGVCARPGTVARPDACPCRHTRHPHDTRAAQGRRPYTIRVVRGGRDWTIGHV